MCVLKVRWSPCGDFKHVNYRRQATCVTSLSSVCSHIPSLSLSEVTDTAPPHSKLSEIHFVSLCFSPSASLFNSSWNIVVQRERSVSFPVWFLLFCVFGTFCISMYECLMFFRLDVEVTCSCVRSSSESLSEELPDFFFSQTVDKCLFKCASFLSIKKVTHTADVQL